MLRGDHVKLLMRMCQRFIMWRLGIGTSFFQRMEGKHEMESSSAVMERETMRVEELAEHSTLADMITAPI